MCWLIQYMKSGSWSPLHDSMCSCDHVKEGGKYMSDQVISDLMAIHDLERIKIIWQGRAEKMAKELSVSMDGFIEINKAHKIKEQCSYVINGRF